MKFIGNLKCVDVQDLENGECKVVLEYDHAFKEAYKALYGLKRFSKKHFERTLSQAIDNYVNEKNSQEAGNDDK